MADIDLSEFIEEEYGLNGWLPVGNKSKPFNGVLDGNNKTISGFWINRNSDYCGLFGYINTGSIKNLSLKGEIKGKNFVGAFFGDCIGDTGSGNVYISNLSFSGTINGDNYVGAICGSAGFVHFDNIRVEADVNGTGDKIGGITGKGGLTLSNCYVFNSNISGANYVGGLSGYGQNSNKSYFVGTVTGISYVGGIIGYMYGGNVSNCYVIGDILASGDNIGGIVGNISPNTVRINVTNSYFNGVISGNDAVGGIVGYNAGIVKMCYASANVNGKTRIGGICGTGGNCTLKQNAYSGTFLRATEGKIGRIYGDGYITTEGNIVYNRSIIISAGVAQDMIEDDPQNGSGVSATTLKLKATYVAMEWDFTDIWAIQETECYPYFKTQTAPPIITSDVVSGATTVSGNCVSGSTVTLDIDGVKQEKVSGSSSFSFSVEPLQAGHEVRVSAKAEGKEQSYYTTELVSFLGKGTEADPYQVYTAADLTCVYRRGYYKQMNDIDLADYINQFSPTEGWQSIGRDGSETIHYDGAGHKVTGLWCNSTRDNTGLFSCFANGEIKNLTVETAKNKQVKGGANTGIIIGKMMNGTITNCRVSGTVADGTPVGGIVGLFDGGAISNCQAKVTINTTLSTSYVGGLVGESTGGTIDQCFTEGTLTATGSESYVGGIVGKNLATLTNSNSTATITSSYNAAGVVAYNYGLVDKCYATGNLLSNNYAAGVIGYNDGANAVVSNCVAMNNKIEISYESQQQQQGGGYGQRIIGGIKNGAPAPEMNNYALKTMQVSLNDVTQKVYDDIMNGTAKTAAELTMKSTYQELDWDFSNIWKISEGAGYPYLNGTSQVIPDDPGQGGDEPEPVVDPDTDISSMNNVIYLNKVEASAGSQINLSIRMKNAVSIRGFQFDLYLPDGVTVVKSAKGKIVGSLSDGRLPEDDEHTLTLSEQSDGAIRFLCGSLYDETFTGNDGEIATLSVKIAENMADGNYAIILKDIKMTETDINNYYQTEQVKSTLTITSYTSGDINGDGKVDVSDYIGIANHIMGSTPEGFVVKAADVNEDGIVDVSDYIGVANIILTGSIYGNANNARMFLYEEDVEQEIDPE